MSLHTENIPRVNISMCNYLNVFICLNFQTKKLS